MIIVDQILPSTSTVQDLTEAGIDIGSSKLHSFILTNAAEPVSDSFHQERDVLLAVAGPYTRSDYEESNTWVADNRNICNLLRCSAPANPCQ